MKTILRNWQRVLTAAYLGVFPAVGAAAEPPVPADDWFTARPAVESGERHVLENNTVRLEFDGLGRPVQIVNRETGVTYMLEAGAEPAPAFLLDTYSAHQRVYIDDPLLDGSGGFSAAPADLLLTTARVGDLQRLAPEAGRRPRITVVNGETEHVLTCLSTLPGGIEVTFTVSLPCFGGLSRWRIGVVNAGDAVPRDLLRVYRVAFPVLSRFCIAGEARQNFLARPFIQGELIPNPAACSFKRPERPLSQINVLTYPGWASMPWQDLYHAPSAEGTPASGLYFASYDPLFQQVDIESVPNAAAGTLTMAMRTLAFLEPGETWQSQTFVVGVHRGDWHWAADRYREDSRAWFVERDVPGWVNECDGWFGSGGPNYRYEDLPEMLEQARWLGLNYLQCWSQMLENVGPGKKRKPYYCFFLPDPDRGGEKGMTAGVRAVRKMGGHIGFYSNFWTFDADIRRGLQQWAADIPRDVAVPDWNREFKKYAAVFPDGHMAAGSYTDGYAGMCAGAQGWRDYLLFWIARKYVRQYGVDAWYLDSFPVTMFAADRVCFSPHHGPGRPHGMGQGLVEFARQLHKATARTVKLAVASESAGDVFMQYNSHALGIELVGGVTPYPRPEIYTYTFPHHPIFSGSCNNQLGLRYYYPDLEKVTREAGMNRVFLMGFRFDVLGYRLNPKDPYMLYLRDLIALRKRVKKHLYASSFRDDLGLGPLPPKVEAKVFRHDRGRSLTVTLLDRRPEKQAFTLVVDPAALELRDLGPGTLHTLDGGEQKLARKPLGDGACQFSIPARTHVPVALVVEANGG